MRRLALFSIILLVFITLVSCKKPQAGSWTPVYTEKSDTFFELNFISPEVGWLTGWFEKGPEETNGWEILQTKDGGKTWTVMAKQAENKIQYVYFVNDKKGWALNLNHDILLTADGGETWTVQRPAGKTAIKYFYKNPGAPTEVPDPLTNIKFLDEKNGWSWGGGGGKKGEFEQEGVFLHTENGGENWQSIRFPFANELKTVYFMDAKYGWASDKKAGIYKTLDGGANWLKQPDDERRPSINSFFFLNKDKGWMVGDRYIGITEDGGQTWKKIRMDNSYFYDIYFVNDSLGWAVGDNNTIMRSENGGLYWYDENSGLEPPVTFTKLKFFNNKVGWAGGLNGALVRYDAK